MSPEQIRPFPKARKKSNYGRKRNKCRIATDTPEKEELENKTKRSVNVKLNFALEDKKRQQEKLRKIVTKK